MKNCPKCGAEANESQKFCSECAEPLQPSEKTVGIFGDEDTSNKTVSDFESGKK